MEELTQRQEEVLKTIINFIKTKGYVPTIIELADVLNINIKTCYEFLMRLENKGYIEKKKGSSRGIFLTKKTFEQFGYFDSFDFFNPYKDEKKKKIPIVGRVVAGTPVFSEVDIEGDIVVDKNRFPKDNYFALKVRGDSMIEAGIYEGDYVIVDPVKSIEINDGDIVVAMIDGEVTLKRIFLNKNEGVCILHPENKNLKDIVVKFDEVEIIGKIVGLQRFY